MLLLTFHILPTFSSYPYQDLENIPIFRVCLPCWASLVAQLVKNLPAIQEIPVHFLVRKIPWRKDRLPIPVFMSFPDGSDGKKNPPAMWETCVQSLGGEDLLEEDMATHSSILAWGIPMDRGAWQAIVHGVAKSWTRLSD